MTAASATPAAPAVPILHELKISKDAEDWLKTLSPSTFQGYDEIQKMWNSPVSQFTITLVQDSELKLATKQIADQHAGQTLVGYELVLIVFLWTFRAWRLGKASTWLTRLWTQFWIADLYWFLAGVVLPWAVWGDSYRIVIKQVFKAILRHFFT